MSTAPVPIVWNIANADPTAAASLAAAVGVSPLTAQLLLNRGIVDFDAARRFLDPCLADLIEPACLPDIDKAVDRLQRAIESKETIFLHGDYDADGVTAAALCLRALTGLGASIVGFVPSRGDGYDLQNAGVDRAHSAGATLILTADCGSCAVGPVAYANSLGIDTIITDHHRPGPVLPDAVAVVNPHRHDCDEAAVFRNLCGAGVAFKLIDALCLRIAPQHRAAFKQTFLDLVALGTVADMMPLCGENRILVTHGLRALTDTKKTGLRALLATLKLKGRPLDAAVIGWQIGPRLNAAGRMEDADLAFRLLTTRDDAEAVELAAQLDELAIRSREEIARVTTEAMTDSFLPEHEGGRVLVIARANWASGVIGVAAGRMVDQCRRPVILLSHDAERGICHGSARSYGEFNLHAALYGCADLLERFGGHAAAAGLSLPMENLERFRARMHELAEGFIDDVPASASISVDAEMPGKGGLTFSLVEQMQRLAPFGMGNPEPTLAAFGAVVLSSRRVGGDMNTCILTLRLPGTNMGTKAVWFRNGPWADRVGFGDEVDVAFTPVLNEWDGRVNVELSIKDMRISGASADAPAGLA